MDNKQILEMLDTITNYLNKEEYEKILDYISKKRAEINEKSDASSEYIDKLVSELK